MTEANRGQGGGGGGGFNANRSSSLKEAIARRERGQYKRVAANKLDYMDGMQASLNKEIQNSVFPYWRNHASLKGQYLLLCLSLTPFSLTATDQCLFCVCRLYFNELSSNGYKPTSEEALASRPK